MIELAPHMYGELAKTKMGCKYELHDLNNTVFQILQLTYVFSRILKRSNILQELRDVALDEEAPGLPRRAALWAIVDYSFSVHFCFSFSHCSLYQGHMGASETGFQFLAQNNTVELIVDLAETSSHLSIRGYAMT